MRDANRRYWNDLAGEYQQVTAISCQAFHLGPLLPDAREFGLLPAELAGKRCLEIGCGAGQNSIFLASQGARCVAFDIAEKQLAHGRRLATRHQVAVDFRAAAMEDAPLAEWGPFDFIHSTYALPFAEDPERVVRAAAEALAPGGTFLLVMGHPVYAGEWLEIDEEGEGLFLTSYFHPPPDARFCVDTEEVACARYYPISTVAGWLLDAELTLSRLLEPEPLPIPTFTPQELRTRVPYYSDAWAELYDQIARVPVVAAFAAAKPEV